MALKVQQIKCQKLYLSRKKTVSYRMQLVTFNLKEAQLIQDLGQQHKRQEEV